MARRNANTALVLTGGGARAAYQVGVLKAVRELLPKSTSNPFPILVGTSAGAVNAAVLATHARNFAVAVEGLLEVWQNLHVDQVYRADPAGIAASVWRWLGMLMFGWLTHRAPRSLLDNSPLRRLLERHVNLMRLDDAIEHQALRALSITCSGYNSGESISFFQGRAGLEPWRRAQRIGAQVKIEIDHLLASSAIPFVFPAVKVHREYFGDGSMRQLAPISPAIHLGADKILVIGAGRMAPEEGFPAEAAWRPAESVGYPSLAQIAGHTLSSIFLDSLSMDLERMNRINQTVAMIPEATRQQNGSTLRSIDVLVISPSQRLDHLAALHSNALPWPVRTMLRGLGAMNPSGGALVSYLLFEPPYTRALIDLGYGDTIARSDEVRNFLLRD